jgi:hypothetical protein
MNEEFAERIINSIKENYETQKNLSRENIETLLSLSQDLLKAYITEKYKSY